MTARRNRRVAPLRISALVVFGVAGCASFPSGSERATAVARNLASGGEVPAADLVETLRANRVRIEEFRTLREAADRLGIRVWLFGGTAAGYAHYVRWDLLRRRGDSRYQAARFDYDFTSIYRSTQDADLVVDGTPEQAAAFEKLVREKMGHLQGSKEIWEIRLLRRDRGDKLALLDNPDFQFQHTDSNSTGMIELTDGGGESIVRDLRDWNDLRSPGFLADVASGSLKFHFSPRHAETRFFREGRNPEIFSVIRYYTKAFQYELRTRPEDEARLRAIIEAFDPREMERWHPYARKWIHQHGTKLFKHASNIEFGWDALERVGLRRKLLRVGAVDDPKTLAWWMDKEPLRTRPLGTRGKTLREICLERGWSPENLVLAHETSDFLAYESITRDTTGRPNVWISRAGKTTEMAKYGNGFYTRVGTKGARGTGFTVRFQTDLGARVGEDFSLVDDFVVVHNRAMLRVIPESLDLTLLEFAKALADDGLSEDDLGVYAKLARKVGRVHFAGSSEEVEEFEAFLRAQRRIGNDKFERNALKYLLPPSVPEAHRARWRKFILGPRYLLGENTLRTILDKKPFDAQVRLVRNLIQRGHPKVVSDIGWYLLTQEKWAAHPELMESLIRRRAAPVPILDALAKPHWAAYPELLRLRVALAGSNPKELELIAMTALITPEWGRQREFVEAVVRNSDVVLLGVASFFKAGEHAKAYPDLAAIAIAKADPRALESFAKMVTEPGWQHPELALAVIRKAAESEKGKDALRWLKGSIFAAERWAKYPQVRDAYFAAVKEVDCPAVLAKEP